MGTKSMRRRTIRGVRFAAMAAAAAVVATACPPDPGPPTPTAAQIYMSPKRAKGYFSMPWPNDIRRDDQGMLDWTSLPGINTDILTEPLPTLPVLPSIVEKGQLTVNRFGRNTAVFFQANEELAAASLPTPAATLSPGASVQLLDLDTGERAPAVVVNQERADRYRPAHLLTILPYPGHPLRSDARYAALVFDGVTTTDGTPLAPSPTLAQLAAPYEASMPMTAAQHAALSAQYADVQAAIAAHTTHTTGDLVAFTVYRTQKSEREWEAIVAHLDDLPTPTIDVDSIGACTASSKDGGALFALVEAHVTVPIMRNGNFPYLFEGGRIVIGPDGKAQQFGTRDAPVEIMVPCAPMPVDGFPVVTHMDGTGGDEHIGNATPIARRNGLIYGQISPLYGDGTGDAGTILSPLGFDTPREQAEVLFYNLLNPDSIRSNPLQQAAEHLLFTRALAGFSTSGAPFGQPGTVHGDPEHVMITGHSQGAQTLPMVAAADPGLVDGVISSSGSGGQYHTLAHSPRRLNTISLVTNYADRLDELNPLIQVVQTVFEASDGANFANDTHFFNYTNYADTCSTVETGYHFSTAQKLAMVVTAPEISYGEPSLDRTLATLPASGNVGGKTRVSVLLPGGHYNYQFNVNQSTAFQTEVLAGGTPTIPNQSYGWSNSNCPGVRYDDPPRLFGI